MWYLAGLSRGRAKPKTIKLTLVTLSAARHIKGKEQRLVGSESRKCVRVKQHYIHVICSNSAYVEVYSI